MKARILVSKLGSVSAAATALLYAQGVQGKVLEVQAAVQAVPGESGTSQRRRSPQLLLVSHAPAQVQLIDHASHSSHSSHSSGSGFGDGGAGHASHSSHASGSSFQDDDPAYTPTAPVYVPPQTVPDQAPPQTQLPEEATAPNSAVRPSASATPNRRRRPRRRRAVGRPGVGDPAVMPAEPSAGAYTRWPAALSRLKLADLRRLGDWQLKILKNFYYARHGFSFPAAGHVSLAVKSWFQGQTWYSPNTDSSQTAYERMTTVEKLNLAVIAQEERHRLKIGKGRRSDGIRLFRDCGGRHVD